MKDDYYSANSSGLDKLELFFELTCRKYPFLVLPLTVSNAAVQLVQGALKNEEHIYIPGLFRWLAFFT